MTDSAPLLPCQGIEKKQVQELFSGINTAYDSILRYMTFGRDRHWKRLLLSLASLKSGHRVVDAAAGTGVLTYQVGDLVAPQGTVLGLDICVEMLRVAQLKQLTLRNRKLVDFTLAAAEDLPIEDEAVDCFTSCYLFKYCDLHKTFKEAFRILKADGKFVGYDLTRPSSGVLGRLSSAYIFRGMPLLSRIALQNGTKRMLQDLPKIIADTDWDVRVPDAAAAAGFSNLNIFRVTSGVVTFVFCEKPSSETLTA